MNKTLTHTNVTTQHHEAVTETAHLLLGVAILALLVLFWMWLLGFIFQPQKTTQAQQPVEQIVLNIPNESSVIVAPKVSQKPLFTNPVSVFEYNEQTLNANTRDFSINPSVSKAYLVQVIISIDGKESSDKLKEKGTTQALAIRKKLEQQGITGIIQLFVDPQTHPDAQGMSQVILQSFNTKEDAKKHARRSIFKHRESIYN